MLKENKENILVTAAIEDTFGTKERIFFLGEWCKQGIDSSLWIDRDHETITFYLSEREKFKRDHDYLEKLFERVLELLVVSLNNYQACTVQLDTGELSWDRGCQLIYQPSGVGGKA